MGKLPKKCLVDTNIPKTANLATESGNIPVDLIDCVLSCIEAVEHIVTNADLVLDDGDEIFREYRQQLSLKGQPGIGDRFVKWVHDNRWGLPDIDRVQITKNDENYDEFPDHIGLTDFDKSDRKFVAVSNAHPQKPPILQATDSKWWGWQEALAEVGIEVHFLCTDYIQTKYDEKIGS